MAIKIYKPTTPSRRNMSSVDFSSLSKHSPEKSKLIRLKKRAGRDRFGHISVRHQGSGVKRKFRIISSLQDKPNQEAKVISLQYDPNRSAFINLLEYKNKEKIYIIASDRVKIGDMLIASDKTPIKPGNRMRLKNIPSGIEIHDIELVPDRGGKIARSAGCYAIVSAQVEGQGRRSQYAQIKMPSGEIRLISQNCFASIGVVSNPDHSSIKIGKAGRSRWMGIRPSVRGTAMHPAAHPHGGGEGRSPIGLKHPKTPWGKPALGYKTRNNKRTDRFIIKDKRK